MPKNLPTISIIMVSFNNESFIHHSLDSIKTQNYPIELLEYILVDGGSTDHTKKIADSYGFKIIDSPYPRNAEAQRAIGLREAKSEILAYIDTDNVLPYSSWLRDMTEPFIQNQNIICSQTIHYTYRKTDSLFNRYCALFGGSDPVAFYVGRPDRLPYFKNKWTLGNQVLDKGNYLEVKFSEKNLPTVGCNGVLIRRLPILNFADSSPEKFLHIDVFVDLLRNGFNTFAIVKNDVIHLTAQTLSGLIKKRKVFLKYYFNQKVPRRYKIYDSGKLSDNFRLAYFILLTLTIVKPVFDSLRGYFHIRDKVWFVHPFVCLVYLYAYGLAAIKNYEFQK